MAQAWRPLHSMPVASRLASPEKLHWWLRNNLSKLGGSVAPTISTALSTPLVTPSPCAQPARSPALSTGICTSTSSWALSVSKGIAT
jgi:hypothetical protein